MNVAKPETGRESRLKHTVHELAHLLPAQGPIDVFIHHNTLHAFQHLPFEEAVLRASEVYGAEPYLSESRYRSELRRGRIRAEDIDTVLARQADNSWILPGRLDRSGFRRALLLNDVRRFDPATIRWQLEETDLLQHPADARSLFEACLERFDPPQLGGQTAPVRPRDGVHAATQQDSDEVVHRLLIRLSQVYLDQGLAYWPMPGREKGFLHAVRSLMTNRLAVSALHLQALDAEFERQAAACLSAEGVILEILDRLGISEKRWTTVLRAELLALPGWAGIFSRLEGQPSLAAHQPLDFSLLDFLAVRLTLTYVVISNLSRETGQDLLNTWDVSVHISRDAEAERLVRAAQLFDAAQLTGLSAVEFTRLEQVEFARFEEELSAFSELDRRRIFHLAYERRHEQQILGPLAWHRQKNPPVLRTTRPSAQLMFCLDEREESLRRHLEELDPTIDTMGAAGFFSVAIDYAGIDDPCGVSLCPVVVQPQHAVRELPLATHAGVQEQRQSRRRSWARWAHIMSVSSRSLVRGWVTTAALGALSLFPLAARVLAPRQYARLRDILNRSFFPQPETELTVLRRDAAGHAVTPGLAVGFTDQEQADRVGGLLTAAGFVTNFARIVVICGHGSSSLNNPHESAYNCGACGGRKGGPNGRLFSAMANRKEVRDLLRVRGIDIPDDTHFVGALHDTCTDDVEFFDLAAVPESHRAEWDRVESLIEEARRRNAHERSRRFESADPYCSADEALRHVEERAEHLAQPRPELGHATNAVCIVGRRATTRGLYLDRRAFLVCYDAARDPREDSLTALMSAAGPVCAGINLEYYFSHVDNQVYGCGSKLPHNVTGLIGVMNGHASDLRTGLPWQMVEIHEPVRILFVIENTPERVMAMIPRNAVVQELVEKEWLRLATLDPESGAVHVYRSGVFVPFDGPVESIPVVTTSRDWYCGKIDHLQLAQVAQGLPSAGTGSHRMSARSL